MKSFLWRLVVTMAQWGCWAVGKEGRIRLGWGRRQSHLTYFQVDAFFYLWLKMISLGSSLFPFFIFYFYFFLLHANAFFYGCTLIVSVFS